MINIDLKKLAEPIAYRDKILLVGSCFTEHIGNSLGELKFKLMQNPNGILFDPISVCKSLISYIQDRRFGQADLFHQNEIWHSWAHHSRFSRMDPAKTIEQINHSQAEAHSFLKEADWLIITLGSSFSYRLKEDAAKTAGYTVGTGVANCHRAPATWFQKHLLEISETIEALDNCYHQLMQFNPKLRIIFTVSPVRHLRDGVVENNRSKARLIEAVHHMVSKFDRLYYFPAYELVIDVLRDYRFYDIDMAHPNYMATSYVLEQFIDNCIDPTAKNLMEEIRKINIARKHRAFQPESEGHRQFLRSFLEKTSVIQEKHPYLDLSEELTYFGNPG